MKIPSHDEQGRKLLSWEEYKRLGELFRQDQSALSEEQKRALEATADWRMGQKMNTNPATFRTSSGLSYDEVLEIARRARTQQGK